MSTRTTFHLTISRPALALARVRAWLAQRDPIRLVAPLALALLCLIIALALVRQLAQPAPPPPTIITATPGLIVVLQTAHPAVAPTTVPTTTPRMITAYDAPNGAALGPIPEPPMSAIVARWGDAWLQTTWDNAPVWIKVEDLGASLADVRPALPAVVIAPAGAAAEPAYHVADAPAGQLGPPPVMTADERAADAAYRQQIGLTDADMDRALAEHQAQQAASCAAGRITNAAYCAAVNQWMEEHR